MEHNTVEERSFDEAQYVVFKLGREVFGLAIDKVKEIIMHHETTQLPDTMEEIEGIINLRGHVIPIYDIRKKFGFPITNRKGTSRIVVVEVHNSTIGIIVDGVSEVLSIQNDMVEKPSFMLARENDTNFINGIAKLDNALVILLDIEKVIDPEMAQAV